MRGGRCKTAYIDGMPVTPLPAPLTDEEIETRLLAAAVAEAASDDQLIPHEVVRAWMLEKIEELQQRIDAIVGK